MSEMVPGKDQTKTINDWEGTNPRLQLTLPCVTVLLSANSSFHLGKNLGQLKNNVLAKNIPTSSCAMEAYRPGVDPNLESTILDQTSVM